MLKVIAVPVETVIDGGAEEMLSEYRREKIARARNIDVRRERTVAGVLLALALKRYFGIEEADQIYAENGNGKPYFPEHPEICFNISHSRELCVVALSHEAVGIDAESIGRSPNIRGALRCFSERERKWYALGGEGDGSGFSPCDREEEVRFLRLWTAKESAVKCSGRGIAAGFADIEIPYFENRLSLAGLNFSVFREACSVITLCSAADEQADYLFLENLKSF